MPPLDRHQAQAAATRLGLELSLAQADQLLSYLALLQRWNATYNLTAVRDPAAMWTQHVLDCMAALPSVRRHLAATLAPRLLDVGSGGGLPGVVWAVLMPAADITCVDAVGKKAAFVRQVAGALGLSNLHATHARVETLRGPPYDLITCRAFSSLADFIRLTQHLLKPTGAWVAMKGKAPVDELTTLTRDETMADQPKPMFHVEPLLVPGLGAERCLVWLQRADRAAADPPSR